MSRIFVFYVSIPLYLSPHMFVSPSLFVCSWLCVLIYVVMDLTIWVYILHSTHYIWIFPMTKYRQPHFTLWLLTCTCTSALLLANLRTAESSKGFTLYLLSQIAIQLLAFIIIFWHIFVFWNVDQSDFSIPKNNNKWQMLFLSKCCHSPRSSQW